MSACRPTRARWFIFASTAVIAASLCGVTALAQSTKPRSTNKRTAELSPWEKAAQGRDTLEAIPAANRTKTDYAVTLEPFRAIYHDNPRSPYAAPAVNAVAELLAEQGRTLHDPKSF